MRVALGVLSLVVGSAGMLGQLASALNVGLASRPELPGERSRNDAIYTRLERASASWDLSVVWTLPVAGVLMLLDQSWWPYVALVASGVCAASGGREIVKILCFQRAGVRIGEPGEIRLAVAFTALWSVLGVVLGIYALVEVV
jgi:hypothetical protein